MNAEGHSSNENPRKQKILQCNPIHHQWKSNYCLISMVHIMQIGIEFQIKPVLCQPNIPLQQKNKKVHN